ncbi:metallophosphoesterase [Acetonema longum]|uniref:Metallophosphoesterase n=1 Tax=Acetonema longum DSM 6540 TaxID=1009370 RepID=F7NEG1_9FIRM|nr:metallophosphoesterase [Acetonema longum]EGO65372.1 metallophosphoesterase [Acetonema longum DSM 6540]
MRNLAWYIFNVLSVGLILGLNGLACILLARLSDVYKRRWFLPAFWSMTVLSLVTYGAGRIISLRMVTDQTAWLGILVYLTIIWNVGVMVLLALFPVWYGLYRFGNPRRRAGRQVPQPVSAVSRRQFISGVLTAAPVLSMGLASYGVVNAETYIATTRISLPFPSLPAGFDGLKVAQISDTHLGLFFSLKKLDRLLNMIREEQPDLLVITGDFVDDLALLQPALAKIEGLHPSLPLGILYCLGNHEYFRDIERVRREFTQSSIPLLDNRHVRLQRGNDMLYVAGVDYPLTHDAFDRLNVARRYLDTAMQGIPDQAFTLLLAHHPDFITAGFERNIPLSLTGHTHGGQVALFGQALFAFAFKYTRGLYQEKNRYGYVSTGAGHWMPFRFNCPAEMAVFTLKRAGDH